MAKQYIKPEQIEPYIDAVVNGYIPEQETFTKDEVAWLMTTVAIWCSLQLEHEIDESFHDDVQNLVANAEFETIEEGIEDVQEGIKERLYGLMDFMQKWFGADDAEVEGILSPIQRKDIKKK